jgi:hypothetical protein
MIKASRNHFKPMCSTYTLSDAKMDNPHLPMRDCVAIVTEVKKTSCDVRVEDYLASKSLQVARKTGRRLRDRLSA